MHSLIKSPLALLPIQGVLTWRRFTVNFLSTTVMLTVYCNLREGQIAFSRDLTIPHLDLSHFALCIMGN